ncbi:MAG: FkbM family methyltransferase [Vicingaceae bacterium]|nr:FkbM family methyltransferase [Vicingaceae bacterium]
MKNKLKKILIKLLTPLNKKLGFVIKANNYNIYEKNYLLLNLIKLIKSKNFEINLIIDVGANHGTWTRLWKKEFPEASYILIEPQNWLKNSFEDLLDAKTVYLPIGAGKENGTFKFTINSDRDDSSSFNFSEKEAKERDFVQIDIPIKTLNEIVKENGNTIPEIVKIDAEGLDLEVLDGASDLFDKTELFLVEVAINNKRMPNDIKTVINYMDNKGYKVFEMTDLNRPFKSQALWLAEFAFIKKNGFFDTFDWKN